MKKKILLIALLMSLIFSLSAQEISEKKEIAVFALSYYGWDIPANAFGLVDSEITDVFVNLGRFKVSSMEYRLSAKDVGAFINEIRKSKEQNIEVSEDVRLGEATFTEADFNRLTGAFIVVVPVIAGYSTEINDDGNFETNITSSFTFINVETQETFASFNIETIGYGESRDEAIRSATSDIASQLTFEIRSVPEFILKTGIVEVFGRRKILMEFGTNMGVKKGDEFVIMRTKVLESGHQLNQEAGLIKINEVDETLSYGYVLYSKDAPYPGEQLKEIPRLGVDGSVYLNQIGTTATMIGLRTEATRGFYGFRPIAGVEIPIAEGAPDWGLPVNAYVGGAACWYMGRLFFQPTVGAGIGGYIPISEIEEGDSIMDNLEMTHIGGFAEFKASYLFSRDLRVFVDAGYAYWNGILDDILGNYGFFGDTYKGSYIGAGVTLKL
ncbi:MAG: hypothetical protein JEY99_06250 [Spirochaetales bacterium]|nr:hypothetical protein [Spirochaetales bacterium]